MQLHIAVRFFLLIIVGTGLCATVSSQKVDLNWQILYIFCLPKNICNIFLTTVFFVNIPCKVSRQKLGATNFYVKAAKFGMAGLYCSGVGRVVPGLIFFTDVLYFFVVFFYVDGASCLTHLLKARTVIENGEDTSKPGFICVKLIL